MKATYDLIRSIANESPEAVPYFFALAEGDENVSVNRWLEDGTYLDSVFEETISEFETLLGRSLESFLYVQSVTGDGVVDNSILFAQQAVVEAGHVTFLTYVLDHESDVLHSAENDDTKSFSPAIWDGSFIWYAEITFVEGDPPTLTAHLYRDAVTLDNREEVATFNLPAEEIHVDAVSFLVGLVGLSVFPDGTKRIAVKANQLDSMDGDVAFTDWLWKIDSGGSLILEQALADVPSELLCCVPLTGASNPVWSTNGQIIEVDDDMSTSVIWNSLVGSSGDQLCPGPNLDTVLVFGFNMVVVGNSDEATEGPIELEDTPDSSNSNMDYVMKWND